jgi:serine/threonine protein kinase
MGLDEYDVIRELGRGGMAVVHLARQRDLHRLVALKELGGFNARDPAFAERFLRESRMAGGLNHPNIVTVYEYFEDGGIPYIAMELIEGGSLRPLVGELSLPKVARVLEDLLAAVGYAGRNGIVHRDLKHENALITKEGHVKVADFGIAKAAASGQAGLTSEGMTVGTPEYMSPEQALARDVGPASDLYSIGCMTYEMLTGRLPFTSDSQAALLVAHVNEKVPDVREVDPHIPESVALWVTRMTEKDPDDRFPDAAEAWEAFEEAVLEFIGPLWRREATIEPATSIDLSDIPAQTDTPLRPPDSSKRPSSTPIVSTTGYQTYQAPAALHEVLGTDEGPVAPTIATPPPSARPAPRHVTPPPVPSLTGAPAAVKPAAAAEPETARKLPIPAIAAAALIAAVVGFVVGTSGGGQASLESATGNGFVLQAPAGWNPAPAGLIASLGSQAVALAPPGAAAGQGVAAARMPLTKAVSLLSTGAAHVTLGAGEAVRVAGKGDTIYVLPTDTDALVVGCTTAAAVQSACDTVAGSVKLTGGHAVAPGPTAAGAGALRGALTRLRSALTNPTGDLAAAKTARAQASAASALGHAYTTAAGQVKAADAGALATAARDRLATSLKAIGSGWARYATGARAKSATATAAARSAIARGRSRLAKARAALAAVGYPAGG